MQSEPSQSAASGSSDLPRWISLTGVLGLAAVLYLIRITAPADLADGYHQERAAAYVLDALHNGNWICQYGAYGEVTSKPPMLTWLAAFASLPGDKATWFSLSLPGAVATLAISCLIYLAGSRFFGRQAGFLAAFVYVLSSICARQIVQVRIDGLFSLTVLVTALIGFRCWMRGGGWVWFWIAAAVATLTKGPLGVLLAGVGLLACWWEKRGGTGVPLRGSHWLGILLFFLITAGWLGMAYASMGQPLIDKMIGRELVGHAVKSRGALPGQFFYLPTITFLSRFAPWSVLACLGFWRIFKSPAQNDLQRRFERFVFCAFSAGLAVFSLSPHQRPDLLFPIIPFAALIAGRELSVWVDKYKWLTVQRIALVVAVVAFSANAWKFHVNEWKDLKVIRTAALRQMAAKVQASGGSSFPILHVDSSFAFQVFLNTKRPMTPLHEAAGLLRGTAAAFVAIRDLKALEKAVDGPSVLHQLAGWEVPGKDALYIVSNHPRLEWTTNMAEIRFNQVPAGENTADPDDP